MHLLRSHRALPAVALLSLVIAGCDRADAARADTSIATPLAASATSAIEDTSYRLAPGYRVDSLLSTEEALRRFRAGVDSVGELAGGAPSLDSLVRRFVRDVERADTSDLRALHLTRAEYSWLVYPESPLAHPPYRQPPELAWMLLRKMIRIARVHRVTSIADFVGSR